ncbi:MAG: hypothetical protein CR217_06960 [Beijerinckiaceae bacterium]|nr:MAG: hypothetical protein CR217_06960 [Beijerinckiaceae bacterium]
MERHALTGIFLQGFAIGFDGLLEPRRPALPLAERLERSGPPPGQQLESDSWQERNPQTRFG